MVTVTTQLRGGGPTVATFPDARVEDYSFWLDRPGTCTFYLPARLRPGATVVDGGVKVTDRVPVKEVCEPGVHEVVVRDRGTVVWVGPVLPLEEQLRQGGSTGSLKFVASDLRHYLGDMIPNRSIETAGHPEPIAGATTIDPDQHLLIRDLVDLEQARPGGDRGIDTTAMTFSGTPRQRQYPVWQAASVGEIVDALQGVIGGPDVWIDPATRRLRAATPRRGGRRPDAVYNDRNVRGGTRRVDPSSQASQLVGLGTGIGQDRVRVVRTDSSAVARYGLTVKRVTYSTIKNVATLRSRVDRDLADVATPPNLLSLTVAGDEPPIETIRPGDDVRVHVNSVYDPIDEFQRIVGVDVQPGANGAETTAVLHLEPL